MLVRPTVKITVRVVTLGSGAISKGVCTSRFGLKRIVCRHWVVHDTVEGHVIRSGLCDTHDRVHVPPTGLLHERVKHVLVDLVAVSEVSDTRDLTVQVMSRCSE